MPRVTTAYNYWTRAIAAIRHATKEWLHVDVIKVCQAYLDYWKAVADSFTSMLLILKLQTAREGPSFQTPWRPLQTALKYVFLIILQSYCASPRAFRPSINKGLRCPHRDPIVIRTRFLLV